MDFSPNMIKLFSVMLLVNTVDAYYLSTHAYSDANCTREPPSPVGPTTLFVQGGKCLCDITGVSTFMTCTTSTCVTVAYPSGACGTDRSGPVCEGASQPFHTQNLGCNCVEGECISSVVVDQPPVHTPTRLTFYGTAKCSSGVSTAEQLDDSKCITAVPVGAKYKAYGITCPGPTLMNFSDSDCVTVVSKSTYQNTCGSFDTHIPRDTVASFLYTCT
eukprot:m.60955 g.60955  ORF g.60955 m.60955 type:complete len:217 (-) comp22909_c0_seq1:198-848(-)